MGGICVGGGTVVVVVVVVSCVSLARAGRLPVSVESVVQHRPERTHRHRTQGPPATVRSVPGCCVARQCGLGVRPSGRREAPSKRVAWRLGSWMEGACLAEKEEGASNGDGHFHDSSIKPRHLNHAPQAL